MATETSAQGGTNGVNVDGVIVNSVPTAPTSSQSIRQSFVIGKPDGSGVFGDVEPNGAQIATLEGGKATYSAAANIVLASGTTDFFTLTGSATKIVKIRRIILSASATTAAIVNAYAYIRSAANTGGTSSNIAVLAHDPSDPAATAVAVGYTANPTTLGTGIVAAIAKMYASTGSGINQVIEWRFGDHGAKPLFLRDTSHILALNLGSGTISGGGMGVNVEWTEE